MGTTSRFNPTEEKALALLGAGLEASVVAHAVGVTPARISHLLADEEFKTKLVELRYQNLQKHNARDATYDDVETELIEKLSKSLALIYKPEMILKAIQVVNSAKRRGQSAPEATLQQQNVVNLVMPTQVINKFTVNVHNQVISAGEQDLLTIQAGNMDRLASAIKSKPLEVKESEVIDVYARSQGSTQEPISVNDI